MNIFRWIQKLWIRHLANVARKKGPHPHHSRPYDHFVEREWARVNSGTRVDFAEIRRMLGLPPQSKLVRGIKKWWIRQLVAMAKKKLPHCDEPTIHDYFAAGQCSLVDSGMSIDFEAVKRHLGLKPYQKKQQFITRRRK